MGTLGVVSEVTLKLRPIPKAETLMLLSFLEGNVDKIEIFVTSLLDTMMEPISLELMSPSLAKRIVDIERYTLAVSFEGLENSVRYQEEFVKSIQPDKTELVILRNQEAQDFWTHFYTIGPNGAIDEVETEASLKVGVVNLDTLKIIRECQILQDTTHILIEAHGGLGSGLCQVNIKGDEDDILLTINQLREVVQQLGGYVVVKHSSYLLRQKVNVWGDVPAYFFLLKGIKTKVDPNGVLNENRFVGGI
jgi:glycolate oxidase FAD binding subunit